MPSTGVDSTHPRRLLVAVGVVRGDGGRVLMAWRDARRHQGGCWEFPGGKVHPGESVQAALRRELMEEVGIVATAMRPMIRVPHRYPDREVLLDVQEVTAFEGCARGLEGQRILWMEADRLPELRVPGANRPIVTAARLPSCYLITPDPVGISDARFLTALDRALGAGIRLLQLRAHGLVEDPARWRRLAEASLQRCERQGAHLLLNASPELAAELGAGLHLPSRLLRALQVRPALAPDRLLAASCHDAEELAQAQQLGVDFAVLGPVAATRTHPDQQPMGFDAFERLIAELPLPVYAIGGMDWGQLDEALRRRAQGIAAIRGLWPEV
jgi:8-oxo-dGTP diphosphatase